VETLGWSIARSGNVSMSGFGFAAASCVCVSANAGKLTDKFFPKEQSFGPRLSVSE
jgi:hypothetical protein